MKNIQTKNLVDFGLFTHAKDYYSAAQILKENGPNNPYFIMLALSIECFLKSIRTKIEWNDSVAIKVNHTKKTHDLSKIFHKIEINHPLDAEYLKNKYEIQYSRSLKQDIELNKTVFTDRRYPYSAKGGIPEVPLHSNDEGLRIPKDKKDKINIAVYVKELEAVAKFLSDVLSKYID
ncbi:hypothetical protein [Psychromonas algicola]|uniref:hypothetical protein n=1 Tax=Psychromonas algicola TaxID=2555642 RepID=UPI0010672FF8|nr:hypothetical protein [Psychromonas sp. RZ5]TEW48495.1 hypothetical protein E2R67_11380 [Psychromonas sp. RZ5]